MKLDWQRYVPLGIDAARLRSQLLLALGAGVAWSLRFLIVFSNARSALYQQVHGRRFLVEGRIMPDFAELLQGSFWGLALVAAAMIAVAAVLYFYHYQGSRSIYTMGRLPDRWDLWRRCLSMPVWTAAACLVAAGFLTLVYFSIYMLLTPQSCLRPGQWRTLWGG